MPKMNVNLYVIEDYENETAFRLKKTNPNKPNSKRAKMNLNIYSAKEYENILCIPNQGKHSLSSSIYYL